MAKYYISTPMQIYADDGYKGKIVLIRKRKGSWNVILARKKQRKYLGVFHDRDFPPTPGKLVKIIDKTLRNIVGDYRPWAECYDPSVLPTKGFEIIYGVWLKVDRKRRTYRLCVCDGYRILSSKYISKYRVFQLINYLKEKPKEWQIRAYLWFNFGIKAPEPPASQRPSREDWGVEEYQSEAEDWGWGEVEEELLEDGDYETLQELYEEGYIDEDYEED